jgi:hypothetical protein
MPQLDKVTFMSQFVWLLITFTTLYILSTRLIIPTISKSLITRRIILSGSDNKSIDTNSSADKKEIETTFVSLLSKINEGVNNAMKERNEYNKKQLSKLINKSLKPISKHVAFINFKAIKSTQVLKKRVK